MMEECNFKSKIRHLHADGCNLTPHETVCPDEENCILCQSTIILREKDNWKKMVICQEN